MSDNDIADEVPTTELNAVAVFPHGSGYALAFMDHDGTLTAYRVSEPKLRQLFAVIGNALQGQASGSADALRDLGLFPEE